MRIIVEFAPANATGVWIGVLNAYSSTVPFEEIQHREPVATGEGVVTLDESSMLDTEHEFFRILRSRLAHSHWWADRSGDVLSLALRGSPPETQLVVETSSRDRYVYPLWHWPNDELVESLTTYPPDVYSDFVQTWLEGGSLGRQSP
jgi:hypothetical protein